MSALLATTGPSAYWYLTRGSGVVALILLTASICLGIAGTVRWRTKQLPRFAIAALHRNLTLIAIAPAPYLLRRTGRAGGLATSLAAGLGWAWVALGMILVVPIIRLALRWKWTALLVNFAVVPLTIPLLFVIGSEFMPPLYEGSQLYMPTSPPGLSITEATRILHVQDKILRTFPEVETVFGSVGRATTSTDNTPMGMVNTTVTLKPREQWRQGVTLEKLQGDMNAALQFPGFPNVWTQPIRNRLDMLLTGIKTPVGIKILGSNLDEIQRIGEQIERTLQPVPGTRRVYAERVAQGYFTDIQINRQAIARHGLTVGDVQDVIESAIGS